MIYPEDLDRFHRAARMVEQDGIEAYFSLEREFGREVAGMVLVLFLRMQKGSGDLHVFPATKFEEINQFLLNSDRAFREPTQTKSET